MTGNGEQEQAAELAKQAEALREQGMPVLRAVQQYIAGAAWYAAGKIMPDLPARVEADTEGWRQESDLVFAYVRDALVVDPAAHVMSSELFEHVNDWLKGRGHQPWSERTLAARFAEHDEVARNHIEKRTIRERGGLSRRHGWGSPPARYAAWLGVRFRTDEEDAQEAA